MNLQKLRTFAIVVQHASFSKAAEAIHISQPAVSKAVSDLEQELDVVLLTRTGHQLRLTEAGQSLYEYAQAMLTLEQSALADLRRHRGLETGTLTVGATRTIGTYYMPDLIAQFLQRHPGVDVKVISENTESLQRRLLGFELDIAFFEGPIAQDRVLVTHWLDDDLVILAPKDHPLLARKHVSRAALSRERWVIREPGSGTRAVTGKLLAEAGIEVSRSIEMSGNGAIIQSVACGLGLALVSARAAGEHLAAGKIGVVAFTQRFHRSLTQARLRDKPMSPAVKALTEMTGLS